LTRVWCTRNLSLKGKLTIINWILIPKLIYPCTLLDVPVESVKQVADIIKQFFWNWKRPKIKLDMLIRSIEKGGIKYPCFKCKIKSWKSLWAIRALKHEEKNPLWVKVINALLPKGVTFCYLLRCRPNKKILNSICPNLPVFYKEIILNWNEINEYPKVLMPLSHCRRFLAIILSVYKRRFIRIWSQVFSIIPNHFGSIRASLNSSKLSHRSADEQVSRVHPGLRSLVYLCILL
jgi:hypothetical protein